MLQEVNFGNCHEHFVTVNNHYISSCRISNSFLITASNCRVSYYYLISGGRPDVIESPIMSIVYI